MVELGFAQEMTLDIDLPAVLKHIQPKSFALTELGRTTLPQLLPGDRSALSPARTAEFG